MRSKPTLPREFSIPKGAVKVADKNSDAVAYIYDNAKGQPCARVFFGDQSKPVLAYRYSSPASRERSVRECFEGRQARQAAVENRKKDRLAPNVLEVGDIMSGSYGYNMTSVYFYEVIAIKGQYATIREINAVSEHTHADGGITRPQPGAFSGPEMRKLVQHGTRIRLNSSLRLDRWNTHKVGGVPMGRALNFTDVD